MAANNAPQSLAATAAAPRPRLVRLLPLPPEPIPSGPFAGTDHVIRPAQNDQETNATIVRDKLGYLPIHIAAAHGNRPLVQRLLACDSPVDPPQLKASVSLSSLAFKDERGERHVHGVTPLHLAAFFGHHVIAQDLINAGANHSAQATVYDKENQRGVVQPLFLAVQEGHMNVANVLLASGATLMDHLVHQRGDQHLSMVMLIKTLILGISRSTPCQESNLRHETYFPLQQASPSQVKAILSSPSISKWIAKDPSSTPERQPFLCRYILASSVANLYSLHLDDYVTVQRLKQEADRIRDVIMVLVDSKVMCREVLKELVKPACYKISKSCLIPISAYVVRRTLCLSGWSSLFLLGVIGLFGVLPSPESCFTILQEALTGFQNCNDATNRAGLFDLVEMLWEAGGCQQGTLEKWINIFEQELLRPSIDKVKANAVRQMIKFLKGTTARRMRTTKVMSAESLLQDCEDVREVNRRLKIMQDDLFPESILPVHIARFLQ